VASRWEQSVLRDVVENIDSAAVGGKAIRLMRLDMRLFDARPEAHPLAAREIREVYEVLTKSARDDGRLPVGVPLVKRWTLTADIYSPKLRRFIEVDEFQHFSRARLARLLEIRSAPWGSEYPAHFWENVFPRLMRKPYRDLNPPHRDEQRAYRDELRDRLPLLYGLQRTTRLDEFTLKDKGLQSVARLIVEALDADARRNRDKSNC
jgi:hypothetical protein